MKEKGFTLIELLAVIVILAIIALIATPIILNIINDSKEESNQRSVELYADAVKNAVAQAQLKSNESISGSFIPSNNGKTLTNEGTSTILTVEYDGDVECQTIEIYEEGNVYLDKCKVNNGNKEYTYGKRNIPTPVSFAEDSWDTIIANVEARNIDVYEKNLKENTNNTKQITLTGEVDGTYTVRIANTSTPKECDTTGFSQTACGFVIEFEDIITTGQMNNTNTNVGGWESSLMRSYVNSTIYESLPQKLKENIINTKVVSGHGSTTGETNFTTTDKIYLLSGKEIYGTDSNDTSSDLTRKLDYYNNLGVTTTSYSGAIKKLNESSSGWWLRSAGSIGTVYFRYVSTSGNFYNSPDASGIKGVAVAFRLG